MAMAGHSGQTLNDRLNAARYALAGQGLARVVCKATTEEVSGPKKKHLDYLLQCTHEPNVSIPQLANLLIERTNHSSWVVVYKALVTVHHLMCYGNERFTQYLASSNCTFQLSNFLDKTAVKGYEMSTFIRRYAKYLNEKAMSYRTVAFDFTKIKRGKEDGSLRSMSTDKLIKTIPTLQSQVDSLLEFDCSANDLTNGVINAAFMLLFRDLIRLFACYNDGIINCLEKYFDMNKKQAREALDIYKKFLIRMDKVSEFLRVAENVGIDKGEIPDLTKAPSSLLDALEQHLAQLEGKKGGAGGGGGGQSSSTTNTSSSVTSSAATNGSVVQQQPMASSAAGGVDSFNNSGPKDENSLKKALEEEERMLNKLKITSCHEIDAPFVWTQDNWLEVEKHLQEKDSGSKGTYNPFLSMSPTTETSPTSNDPMTTGASAAAKSKASDDLLGLSGASANPFADILNAAPHHQQMSFMTGGGVGGGGPTMVPMMHQQQQQQTPFGPIPTVTTAPTTNGSNMFASEDGFAAAFGKSNTTSHAATSKLPVPGTAAADDSKSSSPSPTHEIRGAGTTPILPVPPDTGFGDDSGIEENASRGTSPLPPSAAISAPPPSGESSPFSGQSFEASNAFVAAFGDNSSGSSFDTTHKASPARPPPPHDAAHPPTRPPPPAASSNENLFSDQSDFGNDMTAAMGATAAAMQFTGFDANQQQQQQQQWLIQQQLIYQQQLAMSSQMPAAAAAAAATKPAKKPSAFEDLDFAMRSTMSKPPKPVGQQQAIAANAIPPGGGAAAGGGVMYFPPGTVPPAGYVMMPGMVPPGATIASGAVTGFDAFGDVLQPQSMANKNGAVLASQQYTASQQQQQSQAASVAAAAAANQSLFKGDLDSSLASLASNLDIKGTNGSFKKFGQFSSPKNTVKTGAPVQQQPGVGGQQPGMAWNPGAQQQQQQPMVWNVGAGGQQPMMVGQPGMMQSNVGGGGQWPASMQPMMATAAVAPNSMAYGVPMRPAMVTGMAQPVVGSAMPGAVQVLPSAANSSAQRPVNPGFTANTQSSDPFGAL